MSPAVEERYGMMVVLAHVPPANGARGLVKARCDCGTIKIVRLGDLRSRTSSCGCWRKSRMRAMSLKHGHARRGEISPTWATWRAMIQRCEDSTHTDYERYGGRGIAVCDGWRHSFEVFLADMGERPPGKTIDRFPNRDGHYEPENCRWATGSEQAINRDDRPRLDDGTFAPGDR